MADVYVICPLKFMRYFCGLQCICLVTSIVDTRRFKSHYEMEIQIFCLLFIGICSSTYSCFWNFCTWLSWQERCSLYLYYLLRPLAMGLQKQEVNIHGNIPYYFFWDFMDCAETNITWRLILLSIAHTSSTTNVRRATQSLSREG